MSDELSTKVKNLPREPGVYLFKNKQEKVIYVGKAKNLKSRVSSYFQKKLILEPKTRVLVSRITDLEIILTATELEALILEAELIKKYWPKYNIAHKDDKTHLFIVIRKENKLPKVITARKTDLKKSDIKFGPYTNSTTTKQILRTMRKIFPFRDCSPSKFARYQRMNKPCLYGHLSLCMAPCLAETDLKHTQREITRLKNFLLGKSSSVIRDYERLMQKASQEKKYELAAHYRDMLKKFEYVRTSFKTPDQYIDNPNLLEDIAARSLKDLKEGIPILDNEPLHIECYDISNISGKEAVGSMVVSLEGKITKSHYKRFKIKLKNQPDDVFMMKEVLTRRIQRGLEVKSKDFSWSLPDLIVLDGGKGQVSAGLEVTDSMGVKIPVIGLIKKKETLVYKNNGEFEEKNLPETNEGLKLLIRLRDEAHRFAQSYHRRLRLKKIKV